MTITLHGHSFSTCTKRVAIVLQEKQVPFKFIEVDLPKGEHLKPAHLEKQPFGKIPYLDDDGYIIYESRAIARYIAEKFADQGPALIPTDLKAKGHFEQAASVELANYDVYISNAIFENIVKTYKGLTPDPEKFAALIASLEKTLDVYDNILATQRYLAGDEITLADLFHVPPAVLLPIAGSNALLDRPNVARWLKELTERPSWQAVKDGITATA
ncbi:hypothetical protein D9611_011573 [Ephemerocybe angulata]|uniref:glutathione transferase n=1 Tax=Ephemerocybe angulata TaxID=980116 RepID=A0A8H5AV15_9AGAR|nr:hypothetical protein D9611_011573 [Tulosesus angulatus]